jgi:aminotransferase class I and II/3-hydroxyacyl-CoA dehydrogenase-like protein
MRKPIRTIAVIGTGVIGASWTALFLAKGLKVVATDIADNAEASLNSFVDAAWPMLERLGLAPDASRSRLTFAPGLEETVAGADLSQLAALAVFDCRTELDAHVGRYRQNRDLLIHALAGAGLSRFAPAEGAFYLYVDISRLTRDSADFYRRLLAETGVALTPGLDFDPIDGGNWVRLSFAGTTEEVAEAARRLANWLTS